MRQFDILRLFCVMCEQAISGLKSNLNTSIFSKIDVAHVVMDKLLKSIIVVVSLTRKE